jgi:hypothetical protein
MNRRDIPDQFIVDLIVLVHETITLSHEGRPWNLRMCGSEGLRKTRAASPIIDLRLNAEQTLNPTGIAQSSSGDE